MTILKVINHNYNDENSITQLYSYIMNPNKLLHGVYGSNLLYTQLGGFYVAKQINYISQLYGKTGNLVKHYIISYDDATENMPLENIIHSFMLSINHLDTYPFFYALHENTDNLHFHLAIGAVNAYTGKKYPDNKETHEYLRENLHSFTAFYTAHPDKKNKKAFFIPGCMLVYSN